MELPKSSEKNTSNEQEALRPTYAPIAMAMAIAMTTWGLMATSLNISALSVMSISGLALSTWALKSWIDEIVLDWESKQ